MINDFFNNEFHELNELPPLGERDNAPRGLDNQWPATLKASFQDGQPQILRRRTAELRAYPVLRHRKNSARSASSAVSASKYLWMKLFILCTFVSR